MFSLNIAAMYEYIVSYIVINYHKMLSDMSMKKINNMCTMNIRPE
jgi:hypothetical protein